MASGTTTQKFISALLIILILAPSVLFFFPKQVDAQLPGDVATEHTQLVNTSGTWLNKVANFLTAGSTATTAANTSIISGKTIKDIAKEALQEILRAFARRLLAKMTESTINWINTGFHGSPLFLERPGSFFKDIGKSEIKNLVNIIGYDANQPFGKSFAISAIESYKQTFAQNAQYSLSKVINDPALLEQYRNNFAVGGWDAWAINTQFPQNNYMGAQMMYTNELARRIQGTVPNKAELTQAALAQGGGFLSPKSCPSNPRYNNGKNEFQRPSFKCTATEPAYEACLIEEEVEPDPNSGAVCGNNMCELGEAIGCASDCPGIACEGRNRIARATYMAECNRQNQEWATANTCPGGLVNTTPGSVVAAQIMKAITGPYDQTSLAAAMGNSLSAIFDALLNKFMSAGLNALTRKTSGSGTQTDDDFEYNGHTLGSAATDTTGTAGFDWNGPDEEIVLGDFKQRVQNMIDNANQELLLIDNSAPDNPGILQIFENIRLKTQGLDMCLPGPNLGWQNRVDAEVEKMGTTNNNGTNFNELQAAATAFKTWVEEKVGAELPSSEGFVNKVNAIKTVNEQAAELSARKNVITETLVKLESIKESLNAITTQPARGSADEATLVAQKQRTDGMLIDLSDSTSVVNARNRLADAKDNLANLDVVTATCTAERTGRGWTNPGGENSPRDNSETEKEVFCESYPNPPVSCEAVFKTDISDYKK